MSEYDFLIELCRHYIFQEEFTAPEDIDWAKLYKYAKAHNLTAVCHCAFLKAKNKEVMPEKFTAALLDAFFDLVYLYERQCNMLKDIDILLTGADIRYIAFKGAVLRNCYPVPESRAMGDTDIIIEPHERDKVKKLLVSSGYVCTAQNGPVYNYTKDGVLAEVHTRLLHDLPYGCFENPFDYADFNGCAGEFDDNYHFAYLIAHTAHHFKFYGAGIKLILDLAVYQNSREIDFDKVFEYLDTVNLRKFGEVVLSVCAKWFKIGKVYVENTASAEQYLCKSGAFGGENKNKGVAVARKELENGRKYSPISMKIRLAFPSYSKMKEIDYIKFIDGRPYLLPYAWCYRFIYNIRHRKEFIKNAVNSLDDENTKIQAYEELEFFREIGLK